MKKIFTVVLTVALVMSSFGILSFASDYQGHWAEEVISKFVENEIISGNSQGNVNPDVNILRSEFVKIINRFFKYTEKADDNFNDVSSDKWYADEFLIAKKAGYITGDQNGNANPENPITRAEVCVILARILKLSEAENVLPQGEAVPEWAMNAVNSVFKAGYIKGYADGSLKVYANITRAEAISLISRCEAGKTPMLPSVEDSTPVDNNGNITVMGSASGATTGGGSAGGGGGGGGGGSSAPSGVSPARIDVRDFDENTFKLDLNAYYIDEFVFTLKVDGNTYTYDKSSILPSQVSSGYTFNVYDIIFKTVKERASNNEVYEIYIKGLASGNREDTANIKVYEGNIVINLPVPSGLEAAYSTAYNPDEYTLSWNVIDTASEYQWSLYNSDEESATPVASGVITAESLATDAAIASTTVALDSEWGERENLYFTVSAKDEETAISSMQAEPKYLLLEAPEVTGVTYEGDDVYKIAYEKDSAADRYEVKVGETSLYDAETYIPGDADKKMTIKVKGYYEYNETKPSSYIYDFTYSGGNGDNAPYVISSPRQFKNIADNPDKSFILDCDINFEGAYNSIAAFSGILDGAGFTVNLGSSATQGVFATVNNATIKNLTVKGAINATADAGAFAGLASGIATFINCTNLADVTAKSGASYVGGILGSGYPSCSLATFKNCVNYGTIDVNGNTQNNSNAGIAGVTVTTKIENCVNYGRIDGQRYAGGLIGWNTTDLNVSNSANFGYITAGGNGNQKYASGVVAHTGASTGSIKNFFNAGQAANGVAGPDGTNAASLSISDCVNVGATDYPMTNMSGAKTSNSYYLAGTGTDSTTATAKNSDELKALALEGFAKQDGYDYPLPEGIVYVSKEEANAVLISTAAEFMNIANDLSGSYKLTTDIDLSNCNYTAISGFKGVLDGARYAVNLGNSATQGVFASASNFTIKNLTVKGSITADNHVGAFVGTVVANGTATFNNCINLADVTGNSGAGYIGGILGNGFDACTASTFENCVNYGTIKVNYVNNSNGGIIGVGKYITIKNCVNYGRIDGRKYAGGLIGWSTYTINLSNCANFGDVSSQGDNINYAGGVFGHISGYPAGTIKNFLNAGQVINGVAGANNANAPSLTISDCVNVGATGNAVTNVPSIVVNNCYYLENTASDATGATVKTSDELKALNLEGFAIQAGYDYPLPEGITYQPTVTE